MSNFFVPGPAGAAGANGTALIVADEGTAVGTVSVLNFVGAGVAATLSGGTAIATISGGAASAGNIIGFTAVTAVGTMTTSTTLGTVHSTAHVAFSGPTSGTALIRATLQAFNGSTTGILYLGLLNGSGGTVAGGFAVASPEGESAGNVKTISRTFVVTGLSAGTAYDYWLAAKHATNSYTIRWSNAADDHGPLTLEAYGIP